MMNRLVIQLVTFNSESEITACLLAVQQQTYQDFEVIIVDNASEDKTVEVVTALGYVPIILNENIGYAGGHNIALQQAQSDYVLTLNPDVKLTPTFVEKMVAVMDGDPVLGSAAGCLLLTDDIQGSAEDYDKIDSCGVTIKRNRQQQLILHGESIQQLPSENFSILGPDGAAAFYRRAMLDDITVFDEAFDASFFMHKEDIDICWRAGLCGWQSVCLIDAVAYHRRSFRPGYKNRKRVSSHLQKYAVRNRYFLLIKNETTMSFWKHIPYVVAYEIKIWIYILFFERQSLWAIKSVGKHLPELLKKRRYIQENRKLLEKDLSKLL